MAKDGTSVSFAYDEKGLRLSKTVNDVVTRYTYSQGELIHVLDGSDRMTIRRDPNSQPMTIGFNGSEHFFLYNAQGDVVAIANYSGEIVVEYTYDAWGNPLSCTGSLADTLGKKNPFRYRGYVYDEETGLYYLKSRYYDPRVGRFICGDVEEILAANDDLIHCNLFAYCTNDPVNFFDDDGYWKLPNWAKIAIGAAAVAIGVVATVYTGGAALPALAIGVKTALISGAVAGGTSAAVTGISSALSGDSLGIILRKSANAAVDGFSQGFMYGGIMAGSSQLLSAGFEKAAEYGVPTGRKGGFQIRENLRVFSPDSIKRAKNQNHNTNNGTLIKIGSKKTISALMLVRIHHSTCICLAVVVSTFPLVRLSQVSLLHYQLFAIPFLQNQLSEREGDIYVDNG